MIVDQPLNLQSNKATNNDNPSSDNVNTNNNIKRITKKSG